MGNPPFVGFAWQSDEQRADLQRVVEGAGKNIDYVACWYFKAAKYIQGTSVKVAFVSTNSITQGEQAAVIWKPLFTQFSLHIDFACRTFRWDSEAALKAHVHCVIIGFSSAENRQKRKLFTDAHCQEVENINAYLLAAPDVFIERRAKPLCNVPSMRRGNQPTDGGNLIFTEEEVKEFLRKEPGAKKFIRKFSMGEDYIKGKYRYCLWLVGAQPHEIKKLPLTMGRIAKVREMRLASSFAPTRKMADTPMLFREQLAPEHYLAIPKVSSERRRYIPMGYLSNEIIPGDKLFIVPDVTLYHFGVLTSNVHMGWMRAVCGRLKSDYSYSNTIVYNNFPWPEPDGAQRAKIERTAQAILDARALYPDSSLADLYDELTMPPALRTAHQANDRAVMEAYGFPVKTTTESSCVAALMKLYRLKTEKK